MTRFWIRLVDRTARLLCRIFGHRKVRGSIGTVGVKACLRCRRVIEQRTAMRELTRGELERRIAAKLPEGWTLHRINWKKRLAHLTDAHGNPRTELLTVT